MTKERLLSKLGDIHEIDDKSTQNISEEDLKLAILNILNYSYGFDFTIDRFYAEYPQQRKMLLNYESTDESNNSISNYIDLEELTWLEVTYTDSNEIVTIRDIDPKTIIELSSMIEQNRLLELDFIRQGYIHQQQNIYDPLSKDMDNDGVIDRYDADFRDPMIQDIGQVHSQQEPILSKKTSYELER